MHSEGDPLDAQLSAALDGMGEGFCALDKDWRISWMSQAAAAAFGCPREAMFGQPIWNLIPDGSDPALQTQLEFAMHSGGPTSLRTNAIGKSGRTMELRLFRYKDGLGISLRDLTECDLCRVALQASEMRLRLAIDAAEVGVWDWDLATDRITLSDRAKALLGLPAEMPVGMRSISASIHPDDQPRISNLVRRALDPAIREKLPYEYRVIHPDGSIGWVLVHGEVIFGAGHGEELSAKRYVGTVQDITARKQAEEALKESEARLSALADNMPLGMVFQITMSRQREGRRFVYVSQNCLQVNGITPEKALEDPANLDGLILPEHFPTLITVEAEALRDLKPMDVEVQMRHAVTGEVRWFQIISAPRVLANGWLVWDGIQNDITERKRAAEALRQSEERLRTILNELPVGVTLAQVPDGKLLFNNAKMTELLGPALASPISDKSIVWQEADDGNAVLLSDPRMLPVTQGIDQKEILFRRADGQAIHLAVGSTLIQDSQDAFIVSAFYDVTERKRAEEHQRLLINELNHRVKNTLATVQSLATQSFRRVALDQQGISAAQRAFEARLFALARGHDVLTRENWEGADLTEVVSEAFAAYRSLHPDGGEAVEIEGDGLRVTPSMALSLSMALHELCTNALKYGALGTSGGRVRISWSAVASPSGPRLVMRWQEQGGPPVTPPTRKGFGSRLIQDGLARELNGTVHLAYETSGVLCTIDVPLP